MGRDGSPLGGANSERTCCDRSGQYLPPRVSAVLLGLTGRFGAATPFLNQPPLPSVSGPQGGRSPEKGPAVWADPGYPQSGLAEMGSDPAAPPVARPPRARRRVRLESCFPGSFGLGAGGGRGPPHTVPAGPSLCVRVCVRAPCPAARALPGRVPWGPPCGPACARPFQVAPTWAFRSLPSSRPWCGHRTCSHLDSWTRPAHSCLSSGESLCSSCGTF